MSEQANDDNVYETEESLQMYLGLHFPSSGTKEGVSAIISHANAPTHALRFPQRVAQLLVSLKPKKTTGRALDIGCAVRGASFELAKTFVAVDAFDFSKSFVSAAKAMQSQLDPVQFRIPVEADINEEVMAVHEGGVSADILQKVNFFAGDACQLEDMVKRGELSTYDGVIMSNLLCRLPDPLACLNGLSLIVNEGGVVVMVTPFSWLEEYTPRGKWLGGYYNEDSKAVRSKDQIEKTMHECGFQKIHEEEMPLLIREHQRKYQYIVSEATAWRKIPNEF